MKMNLLLGISVGVLFWFKPTFAGVKVTDTVYVEGKEGLKARGMAAWVPGHEDTCIGRDIYLDTGKVKWNLRYGADTFGGELRSGLGLLPPYEGWYYRDFINIQINGKSIFKYIPEWKVLKEDKDEGVVEAVFDTSEAKVELVFSAKAMDDKLSLEVQLEAKTTIEPITTAFLCYPSTFAGKDGKRNRWIVTSTREVPQGKDVVLNADESWIVYLDKICDPVEGMGAGPCALFYRPEETETVLVKIGGYGIQTSISHPLSTRKMHYTFWEALGKSNKEALEYIKGLKYKAD